MNNDRIEDIEKTVYSGNCVVLFGAGIAVPPGQDWGGLIQKLANTFGVDPNLSQYDLVDMCMETNRALFYQCLKESFPALSVQTRTAALKLLQLPFLAYLTTNFDPSFKGIATRERLKGSIWTYPDLPLHDSVTQNIYYLHGQFDATRPIADIDKIVFGRRAFEQAYRESLLSAFLLHVMVYFDVLFICFNPREKYIAEVIKRSRQIKRDILRAKQNAPDTKLYVLWPEPEPPQIVEGKMIEDRSIEELTALGLEVGVFDPKRTEGWIGLEEVLDRWIKKDPTNIFSPLQEGNWERQN